MYELVPLQVLEGFLVNYHVGHVLVLLFVLSVVGVLPTRSTKALSLNLVAFGLLFLVTPYSLVGEDPVYKLLGVVLIVVAPLLFVMARQ